MGAALANITVASVTDNLALLTGAAVVVFGIGLTLALKFGKRIIKFVKGI